jgi:hypothetical protein
MQTGKTKPWDVMGMTRRQYEAIRMWERVGINRKKFEAALLADGPAYLESLLDSPGGSSAAQD